MLARLAGGQLDTYQGDKGGRLLPGRNCAIGHTGNPVMPTGTPLPPQTEGRDGGKSRRGLRNDGDV